MNGLVINYARNMTAVSSTSTRSISNMEQLYRLGGKKKSPAKSRELLCAVRPDIAATHRPEMDDPHFYCSNCTCRSAMQPYIFEELWPYINLEDLSDAKSLLELIKARAHNRPSTFATSELSFSPAASPRSGPKQWALPSISFAD
ncbi:hypothetical protein J4E91_010350 [Alternaria rosae]|nr:hypothetical protein J4E91_010350 [Alternaria rosae]